jgi:uncharacterized protein with PQ loop repeat
VSAQIIGWITTILGVTQGVPQAWRILRTRTPAGVSLAWLSLVFVNCSAWSIFGVLHHNAALAVSCGLAAGCFAVSATASVRKSARLADARFPLLWGLVLLVLWAAAGTWVIDAALTTTTVLQSLPQLRRVFSTDDLEGISISSLVMLVAMAGGWSLQGVILGNLTMVLAYGCLCATSAVIVVRVLAVRRSSTPSVVEPLEARLAR